MVIKSKNISYSLALKVTAAIIIWLSFMCIVASSVFLLFNQEELKADSYFETNQFKDKFGALVYDTVNYMRLKEKHAMLMELEEANASDTYLYPDPNIANLANEISLSTNFMYYIQNTKDNTVLTNIEGSEPIELIKMQKTVSYYTSDVPSPINLGYHQLYVNRALNNTPYYKIYATLHFPLVVGDDFYQEWRTFNTVKLYEPLIIIALIVSIILFPISSIFILCVVGQKEKRGPVTLLFVDRIFSDIHALLVILAAFFSFVFLNEIFNYRDSMGATTYIVIGILLSIDIWIGINYILSIVRQFKAKVLVRNTLAYKMLNILKKLMVMIFSGKTFKPWLLFALMTYGAIDSLLFAIALSGEPLTFLITGFIFGIFNLTVLYFAAKALVSLVQVMEASKEISGGNLDFQLELQQISPVFMAFANNIKTIQGGLKKSVEETLKGERMKTALITNVSHDLKTPLTSIITYVDLLKMEDLNNPKALEYIDILASKSDRMKHLVEDLVEASKASSGNLEVNLESVDLHQLILQASGEFEEKIRSAKLDIRIIQDENVAIVRVDGRYMWRIVENLLSNVVKYALPSTRVYIEMVRGNGLQLLTIKNISMDALNLSPEQLTERFVRGDSSRSTEGSGLGLSIAQSLTTLMGGQFKIEIDGDLFKVCISFPI